MNLLTGSSPRGRFQHKAYDRANVILPKEEDVGQADAQATFETVTLPPGLSAEPTHPERRSTVLVSTRAGGGRTHLNSLLLYGPRELGVSIQTLKTTV